MVLNPPRPSQIKFIIIIVACITAAIVSATVLFLSNTATEPSKTQTTEVPTAPTEEDTSATKVEPPTFIGLQSTVDEWAKKQRGTVAVVIYDLDNDKIAASYNSDRLFNIDSLYKLFVAYEGYLRINNGTWSNTPNYYGNYSRLQCLDLMVRESHSGCAETMLAEIGQSTLTSLYQNQGFNHTNLSNLTSTANDINHIMRIFYSHPGLTESTHAYIMDSFLNQPLTESDNCYKNTCNWRQGFPSGFSEAVKVYNKVGWQGDTTWHRYSDAAILEFSNPTRHYAVAVLTEETNPSAIANLGTAIESAITANQ